MAKNTAKTAGNVIPGVDLSDMQDELVGFPPYWGPTEDNLEASQFYATVHMKDDSDPEFVRWVMQLQQDTLECHKGSGDDSEIVTVHRGEYFTISDYAGLRLNSYIGLPVLIYAKGKSKLEGGKTFWNWGIKTNTSTRKVLADRRMHPSLPAVTTKALPVTNGNGAVSDAIPF